MAKVKGRVLVLGGDPRGCLAVIRSLGRSGLEVHVAWCPLDSPTLKSRYIAHHHVIPEYRSDDNKWLHAFNALIGSQHYELVLPCTDGTILPLQLHRSDLENEKRIYLLPDDVYRLCASKDQTYQLAEGLRIPLPAQAIAQTLDDVNTAAETFGFPIVLKPKTSSSLVDPLARQAVQKVTRPDELGSCAKAMLAAGPVIAQQNFRGKGVGVEVLCKNGATLTAFQHERVHEPLMGGGSSYRRSVPLHAGMLAATQKLMNALNYTGVAMVEYKYNPQTGSWALIEINARFWGSLALSIAAGLDFPRYLYEMLCESKTVFPQQYRSSIYARYWSADIEWMLDNARADHRNPDLMTVPMAKVVGEIGNVLCLRERSDTFVMDDPAPAVADLAAYADHKIFAAARLVRPLRRYLQKHAHRRAIHAIDSARTILFVCHGNICRSPFAAAILERICPHRIAVSSAGCFPKASRCSPETAIQAAANFGIDLSDHRSRVLTEIEADATDVIFVFDRKNLMSIRARFPQALKKVHYLGALDRSGFLEIEDPYGRPVEEFEACYVRIIRILEATFGNHCDLPALADAKSIDYNSGSEVQLHHE